MEGLYLYNIIFMAVYADNSKIVKYVIMGWGKLWNEPRSGIVFGKSPCLYRRYLPVRSFRFVSLDSGAPRKNHEHYVQFAVNDVEQITLQVFLCHGSYSGP